MTREPAEAGRADEVAERVKEAFRDARRGDRALLDKLTDLGPSVVPALAPYLDDPDEAIRREVVILLKEIGGDPALPLLVRTLTDASADLQERAATLLYERYDPAKIKALASAGEALRESVRRGNPSAAAVLLLAYFPGDETERVLRGEQDRPADETAMLASRTAPVPRALIASLAMSRIGGKGGRRGLIEAIGRATLEEKAFLLAVLREVDAPEVLHALKTKTLDDTRETGSGSPIGVERRRRLCDDAVDAFVRRLHLKVDFAPTEAERYTEAQIGEVRGLIDANIPL